MNTSSLKLRWLLVPSLAVLAAMPSSRAQSASASIWSGATSADWNDASNWAPSGVPTGVNAGVDGTSLVVPTITSAAPGVTQLLVNGGVATSAATIDAGGSLTIAGTGGNTGLFVGANGSAGSLTVQNGGSLALTGGDFGVGRGVGDSTLFLKDAGSSITVSNVNEFHIGWDGGGDGTINQSGGTFDFTAGADLRIGAYGGTGHYNLSGAASIANFRNTRIGFSGGTGTLTQSDGTLNQTGTDFATGWGGGTGTYNMDGGVMNASRFRVAVGDNTTGTVTQTAGTVNISDTLDIGEAGGGQVASSGNYQMQGGNLHMTSNWMRIGFGDTGSVGTFTQTGGTVTTDGDHGVILADNVNAIGNLNLNGGVFQAGKIQKGGGTGNFTINGGTLKPVHDEGNFIASGFTEVTIGTNGATFDTAGFDTGVQSPLTGVGGVTKIGENQLKLGAVNTYTGNTIVNAGTFTIEDNGSLLFDINADGINNHIGGNGTGALNLFGHFAFDLTDAAAAGSWTIINIGEFSGAPNFGGNFSVTGWTDNGDNTWTLGDYTFSEATGVLSAVPEPSALALLCAASAFTGIAIYRRRRVVNCQERMR